MSDLRGRDNEFTILRKFVRLLTRRQRALGAGLALMMIVGACLEMIGIGLVAPIVSLVLSPAEVSSSVAVSHVQAIFGVSRSANGLLLIGSLFAGVFLLKNSFLALLAYSQYRFLFNRQVDFASSLLRAYVMRPYVRHAETSTAILLRNVNQEVNLAFSNVIIPLGNLIVEAMIAVAILLLLVAVEPLAALFAVSVIGVASLVLWVIIRRRLSATGRRAQDASGKVYQRAIEALGGLKEATVLGRRSHFLDQFLIASTNHARAMKSYRFTSDLPRLLIESAAICGMLGIAFVAISRGREAAEALPLLGLFGLAAIRLMPAMNRIVTATAQIRHGAASFDVVYEDLQEIRGSEARDYLESNDRISAFRDRIVISALCFRYPGAAIPSLSDVTIEISRGQSVGIVGHSGSGKSTLVDLLLGLLEPTSGDIQVDGRPLSAVLSRWRGGIGYVPQSVFIADDSIRRNVAFGLPDGEIRDELVRSALRLARCDDFVASLPGGDAAAIGENGSKLSGGQRQRVGIARALYRDPDVLIFDEATSGVDNVTESEIGASIRDLSGQKTILVVAHRLTTVQNCDAIIFLKGGRVLARGTFKSLMAENEEFRELVRSGLSGLTEGDQSC